MNLLKEHQLLLMKRECRVLLGRRAFNLWLLTVVLAATLLAMAFSAGSTSYLAEKMNDPFTNWVNIDLMAADDNTVERLKTLLDADSIKQHYGYADIETEVNSSLNLITTSGKSMIFSTLFYETLSNDFVGAVLSKENIIGNCYLPADSISHGSLGVVMTLEALLSLGYSEDNIPAYIDYHSKSVYADTLGIPMLADGVYARAPLPLLAVVKRLPMNKEAIASKLLNEVRIMAGDDCPIDLCKERYASELFFFVPDSLADRFTANNVRNALPAALAPSVDEVLAQPQEEDKLRSWKPGLLTRVYLKPGTPLTDINAIEQAMRELYEAKGVVRVYNYTTPESVSYTIRDNVFSVPFSTLDSITSFEHFIKEQSGLQIEMTQVNAKKNFWAVSQMASVLTLAMIIFAIISIVIFIVNMMQNYFQKVKRNLGTFKAFGLSTRGLIKVYVLIIIGLVCTALAIALGVVWIIQVVLPQRDGQFSYLLLWNTMTLWAVVIILVSTIASVLVVMRRLLRQTPGDLIYDR